jgi:hypothetical protein
VAHLFGEWVSVTVKPDSPIKDGRDLIERLAITNSGPQRTRVSLC